MKNKNVMKTIMSGMLAVGILFTTSSSVFAISKDANERRRDARTQSQNITVSQNTTVSLKQQLDQLVATATISINEENEILDFMNQNPENRKTILEKIKNISTEKIQVPTGTTQAPEKTNDR